MFPIDEPFNDIVQEPYELPGVVDPAAIRTPYNGLSDRELLEHIAVSIDAALAAVQGVSEQVAPMLEKFAPILNNPMLKMLLPKK